jgi:phosphatidylglycerol---prolipoprotein diacylglyceryl transferase
MQVISIDPVIFSLGPLQVRWYGLMYVIAFLIGGYLFKRLVKEDLFKIPVERIDSLITHGIIGMFLGARLIYVFVYNWNYYQNHLDEILSVWKGGLSFHGAIIGITVALYFFAKRNKVRLLHVVDCSVVVGTQGLFFGRMGNFINGELYGRTTDLPWGLIFPGGGPYPRHPSQLYEGILEGLVLFTVLWLFRKKLARTGLASSFFIIGYGFFRFFIEFFREPDSQLGYYFGGTITMGQILCFIMVCVGVSVAVYSSKTLGKPQKL